VNLKQRGLVITAIALLVFLALIWINVGCSYSA
jgi:hypothetical protein